MPFLAALLVVASGATWLGPKPVGPARRVVSLAPSTTELTFALGAGKRVVGVSRFDDYPREVAALPKVGGFLDLNLEAVLALSPDLVVTITTRGARPALERLAAHGVSVLTVASDRLEDYAPAVTALGDALGEQESARALITRLEDELARVRTRYATISPSPRVLCIVGHAPLVVAGPGSFIAQLLPAVGARNAIAEGGEFPQLGLESLAQLAPDVLVDLAPDPGGTFAAQLARLGTKTRLVELPDDTLQRLTPRLPQGLGTLGAALHGAPPSPQRRTP
jgi:iron complex transport system substrate-binding protein